MAQEASTFEIGAFCPSLQVTLLLLACALLTCKGRHERAYSAITVDWAITRKILDRRLRNELHLPTCLPCLRHCRTKSFWRTVVCPASDLPLPAACVCNNTRARSWRTKYQPLPTMRTFLQGISPAWSLVRVSPHATRIRVLALGFACPPVSESSYLGMFLHCVIQYTGEAKKGTRRLTRLR